MPLAEWPETLTFRQLPVGPSRHLVRFLVANDRTIALKEEPVHVATAEFDVLRRLEAAGLPAVTAIGLSAWPGRDEVRAFVDEADRRVLRALEHEDLDRPGDPLLDRSDVQSVPFFVADQGVTLTH